jgi:integrative and conjugative element protein (TIGR02256 family)
VHRPAAFHPDHAYQVTQLERIFEETAGTSVYLGDWHTHPGGVAQPSAIDHRTLRRIARSRAAQCPHPLMLIVAGRSDSWVAGAFTVSRYWPSRMRPLPIELKFYDVSTTSRQV